MKSKKSYKPRLLAHNFLVGLTKSEFDPHETGVDEVAKNPLNIQPERFSDFLEFKLFSDNIWLKGCTADVFSILIECGIIGLFSSTFAAAGFFFSSRKS